MSLETKAVGWTRERPTEPGMYWMRNATRGAAPKVTDVTRGPDGDLWIEDGLWALDELNPDVEWCAVPDPDAGAPEPTP